MNDAAKTVRIRATSCGRVSTRSRSAAAATAYPAKCHERHRHEHRRDPVIRASVPGVPVGTNCGRKAKKNSVSLGLSRFAVIPEVITERTEVVEQGAPDRRLPRFRDQRRPRGPRADQRP
jgi:hypothetical protein